MTPADAIVLFGSAGFLASFYGWFYLSKPKSVAAAAPVSQAGIQEVEIVVQGGYTPDAIALRRGVPVRLMFRREESSECTERVLLPDFGINRSLPAFSTTPIEFTPETAGTFEFVCGMGMVHGQLHVSDAPP